jgi:hypothetical protein
MDHDRYALPCNLISENIGAILTVAPLIGYYKGSEVMKGIFGSIIDEATDVKNVMVIGFLVGFRSISI